ncbi:hypothetical protein G9A89_015255 [Geosiphon pyriformis]|nr:hypothetical protein G9A89_015255 [Geosiphon pyriformis]
MAKFDLVRLKENDRRFVYIKQNKKNTLIDGDPTSTIIYSSKELSENSQKYQSKKIFSENLVTSTNIENSLLQTGPIFQKNQKLDFSSIVKRLVSFPTKNDGWIFAPTRSLVARSSGSDKRKERKYKKLLSKPTDKELISEFSSYAFYAQEAYCLSGEFGKLAEGFYAYAFQPKRQSKEIIIYFKGEPIDLNERKKILNEADPPIFDSVSFTKFEKGKEKLLDIVKRFMESGKTKNYNLKLTGHGEGGSYAVFAGIFLKHTYGSKVTVFTFGEPRIGAQTFAKFIDQNLQVFRITNRNDNVPRFQPVSQIFPYMHHSTEYWISLDNDPCDCRVTMGPESYTDPINVYKCSLIPKFEGWKLEFMENPYCNLKEIDQDEGGDDVSTKFDNISESHWGPYFGYKMGVCPKNAL